MTDTVALRPSRRFVVATLGLVALAFVVRLAFGLLVASDLPLASDTPFYRNVSARLANGEGFATDGRFLPFIPEDEVVATAKHPPAFPLVLAVADLLGARSLGAQRAYLAGIAAVGVGALALAGRLLVNGRVGLVAAGIAAVHPLWFQHAGMVVSEALYLPLLAGVLLAAGVALHRPDVRAFVAVGAMVGVTVLTRVEALLLLPFVVGPLVWSLPARRRQAALTIPLVTLVVVAPWVVRNQVVMGTPVVSLNGGTTLIGANCDETYRGPARGGFWVRCAYEGAVYASLAAGSQERPALDHAARDLAIEYARDHIDELPGVALARLGRTLGVADLDASLEFDTAEGRHDTSQRVGFEVHVVVLGLAAVGVVLLARRRNAPALGVLVGLVLVAVATGVLVYGSTRMRATAEPALALLAATTLVHALDVARGGRPAPHDAPAVERERA